MDKRHILTLILFILCCPVLWASAADSCVLSALVEHTSIRQTVGQLARQNPALHGVAFQSSFSQLYTEIDWQHQSQAFILEKGSGHLLPAAHIDTYLRLSNHTAVWGHASYLNGRHYDITWNSTTDYDLLKPHILADTLGGDTQRERYIFEGGYATQLGQWLLGTEMLFRADHEYRDTDPRMRGIVNELTLRFGAGYEAVGYHWAAAVEGNVYKQNNSVDFYRELGVIPEYQLTGLGTEYARFSGDKRNLQYDGGGVRLLLDAEPHHGSGWYGHATLAEHRYHRMVTENYTLPLTDLFSQGIQTVVGWKTTLLAIYASVDYEKRSGDEHIIGTSATTSFPDRGVLTLYKNHRTDAALNALYGKRHWQFSARVGYKSDRQEYVYPERKLQAAHLYGLLEGQAFLHPVGQLMLTCTVKAAYQAAVSDELLMPFADMAPWSAQAIRHTYRFARANYADLSAQVRGDYPMKGYGLFAELGGGFVNCSAGEHQTAARLSLGITF